MKQVNSETGICFFRVPLNCDLRSFLLQADYSPLVLNATGPQVDEWLDYGCVYVNGRRQRQDTALEPEQIIRLHTRRKHYPSPPLKNLLVEDNEDFLVLDKPAGVPTHPTLDNFRDNAKVLLERELAIPLFTTHRLDVPTEGLLIIAKSADAQKHLNKSFAKGRVEKIYRSLNVAPVPLGRHTHYMNPESRVPKQVQLEVHPDWWTCQLEVLHSGQSATGFWHEIKLLTGKTHQIRAQMAALGAPIVGDGAYNGTGGERAAIERIALECFKLSFTFRSRTFAITRLKSSVAPHFYS